MARKIIISFILITCSSVVLVLGFWPELLGAGWHLLHGDYTWYEGWKIPVPKEWFALHWGKVFLIKRAEAEFMPSYKPGASVGLFKCLPDDRPFDHETHFEKLKGLWTRLAQQHGYAPGATRNVRVGQKTAYCLDTEKSQPDREFRIYCALESETFCILYEGGQRDVEYFYGLLGGMSKQPGKGPGVNVGSVGLRLPTLRPGHPCSQAGQEWSTSNIACGGVQLYITGRPENQSGNPG